MRQEITILGIIATDPVESKTENNNYVCRFRLASTARSYDKETASWVDKYTNWYSVSVFGNLGQNAKNSFAKGDRVLMRGVLRLSNWQKEEKSGINVEVTANSIGHDLQWGTSSFMKNSKSNEDVVEFSQIASDSFASEISEAA